MNCILAIPGIISKYFVGLSDGLSKKMRGILLYYVTSLYLEHKRFTLTEVARKSPNVKYQSVQYFLSEAKWDERELNVKRIEELQSHRQTKSTKGGILIIDDTSNKKSKNCKRTDSVAKQYSSEQEGIVNCQTSVWLNYADKNKIWPVDLKAYWPKQAIQRAKGSNIIFKDKIELAIELITEAISLGIEFNYLSFDNWYLCKETIEFCQQKEVRFISEVKVNRWVKWQGRWHKAGELVKLAQDKGWAVKPAKVSTVKGDDRTYFYYEFEGMLKDVTSRLRFIITRGTNEEGTVCYRMLVTNDLKAPAKEIIQGYTLRWATEVCFQRLKNLFYLDQFQVHYQKGFTRHYYLCMSAYTLILKHLMCGSFDKLTSSPPKTFEQALHLIRDLITVASLPTLNSDVTILIRNKDIKLKIPA